MVAEFFSDLLLTDLSERALDAENLAEGFEDCVFEKPKLVVIII